MRLLLDTSAYSAFKRGDSAAMELVRGCDRIFFSSIVAGELMAGFRWGRCFDRNLQELRDFLNHPRVSWVGLSLTTADRYGRIYAGLRAKGRPVPSNDMWIAAQAMETGADLASGDTHFGEIDGLAWIRLPGAG